MCVSCSQTDTTVYRTVLPFPLALCEINTIELRNTGARFYRQGDIHVKSVCLSEFPSLRYSTYRTTWTHVLFCLSSLCLDVVLLYTVGHLQVQETKLFPGLFLLMEYTSSWSEIVCQFGSCLQCWHTGSTGKCLKGYCTKKGFAYQTLMTYRAELKGL